MSCAAYCPGRYRITWSRIIKMQAAIRKNDAAIRIDVKCPSCWMRLWSGVGKSGRCLRISALRTVVCRDQPIKRSTYDCRISENPQIVRKLLTVPLVSVDDILHQSMSYDIGAFEFNHGYPLDTT